MLMADSQCKDCQWSDYKSQKNSQKKESLSTNSLSAGNFLYYHEHGSHNILCNVSHKSICLMLAIAILKPTHGQAFKYMISGVPKEAIWVILKIFSRINSSFLQKSYGET